MTTRVRPLLIALAAGLLGTTAMTAAASAQTWSGIDGDDWGVSTNWTPNNVPDTNTETATFATPGGFNNLESSYTINAIVATSDFSISSNAGATLTLSGTNPTINVDPGATLSIDTLTATDSVITKTGTGTLGLNNELAGSVLVSDGSLALGYGFTSGFATGSVTGNVELAGTANLTTSSFILAGTPAVGSLTGSSGTTVTLNSDLAIGAGDYSGTISGTGGLNKTGTGTLILNGADTYAGMTTVDGGTLRINGTNASDIQLNTGTTLGGNGVVASINAIGATVAPGNSVGTLTTTGAVTLDAASTFAVEVDGTTSDKLVVGGTANFNGATVVVTAPTNNAQATTYRIVDAAVIASGFNPVVSEALVAFDASLTQTANAVDLVLTRNSTTFQGAGQTGNQNATAGAVDALGTGNPVNGAVAANYTGTNNDIFDQLSGESFASQQTVLVEGSQSVRDTVFDRVDASFAALGDTSGDLSGYAVAALPGSDVGTGGDKAIWGALAGRAGVINATGNTAAVDTRSGGVTLGLDGLLGDWRLGAMLHAGMSSAAEGALNASSRSTDTGIGVYGGGDVGGLRMSFGLDYEHHAINSTRNVTIPGFVQTLTASYGGATAQAFAELSADLDVNRVTLTPFANLALVNVSTDGFTETGGPAALSSAATSNTYAITTLGLRGEVKAAMSNGTLVAVHGGLGWRHVFGSTPTAANSFAGGGTFTVSGAPIATDAAMLEAGVTFDVSDSLQVSLDYNGQLATTGQSHALKGTIAGNF